EEKKKAPLSSRRSEESSHGTENRNRPGSQQEPGRGNRQVGRARGDRPEEPVPRPQPQENRREDRSPGGGGRPDGRAHELHPCGEAEGDSAAEKKPGAELEPDESLPRKPNRRALQERSPVNRSELPPPEDDALYPSGGAVKA